MFNSKEKRINLLNLGFWKEAGKDLNDQFCYVDYNPLIKQEELKQQIKNS